MTGNKTLAVRGIDALDHIIDRYTDRYVWPEIDLRQREQEEQEAWLEQLNRVCRIWALECEQQSESTEIKDEEA